MLYTPVCDASFFVFLHPKRIQPNNAVNIKIFLIMLKFNSETGIEVIRFMQSNAYLSVRKTRGRSTMKHVTSVSITIYYLAIIGMYKFTNNILHIQQIKFGIVFIILRFFHINFFNFDKRPL